MNIAKTKTWNQIKQRCYNPKATGYKYYGGRGVAMCQGWFTSHKSFVADIGPRPTPQHTVDRIDVNGNYSCGKCRECVDHGWPMNCRWATRQEQANNRRPWNNGNPKSSGKVDTNSWHGYMTQARLSLGYTQKQWAARWNVHWTTVARWESGKQTMPAVVTWWLANLDHQGYQGGESKSKEKEAV